MVGSGDCALTVPWANADIGPVGIAGGANVAPDGVISVTGGGTDIGSSTDSFHFAYQPLIGNATIVARVVWQSNTSHSAQSGIMIRESLHDDARFVGLVLTPSHGIVFQDRAVSHNTPASVTARTIANPWLMLVRNGGTITGEVSSDGARWSVAGTAHIALANNVYAGLCVAAHDNTARSAATFSDVAISPTGVQASPWSRAAPDPVTRWESQSFTWHDQLYIFGGFTDRSLDATTDCDAFDPATNRWKLVTHLPVPLTHAAVTVVGDTAYFVGGNIGPMSVYARTPTTSRVLTFNLATDKWGSIASLPVPTAAGGVVNIGSYLYFYGGISSAIRKDYAATWALNLDDPSTGWKKRAPCRAIATTSVTLPSTASRTPSAASTSTMNAPVTCRRWMHTTP